MKSVGKGWNEKRKFLIVSLKLSDHTSVFYSSFVDQRILNPCRQRRYAFWHIFLFLFLPNIPHNSQSWSSLSRNFLFNLISWRQKYQIKHNRKLLFMNRHQVYLQFSVLFSNPGMSDLQVEQIKVTALSGVWKNINCQNSDKKWDKKG